MALPVRVLIGRGQMDSDSDESILHRAYAQQIVIGAESSEEGTTNASDSGILHREHAQQIVIRAESSEVDTTNASDMLLAATTSHPKVLVNILAAKTDPNCIIDAQSSTALHHAVLTGSTKCVEALLLGKVCTDTHNAL